MNTRRFSVSILEEGGRLGLKCLLLSYFRVGDKNKPQAPRSLRQWLASSFAAGIGCESQEVPNCDPPSQEDARRA